MRLEEIIPGLSLYGLEPLAVTTIVAVVTIAEGAVQVIYKDHNGVLKDRLLNRSDEASLAIATQERPWSFDGDGEAFKLAVEAKRIDLAFLFDPMMAVHTSNVEPLPHQITAVYESMLPRQPLRYVLADDPRIEKLALDAVRRAEEAQGCCVVDVSAQKCGWDLISYPPAVSGKQPEARHIEVKGRIKSAGTVTISRNEMLYALNQADKFLLAIVLVGENDSVEGPYYLRNPFDAEPGWGVSSINFEIKSLLEKATPLQATIAPSGDGK
jgi:hypothetical protein